MTNVTPLRAPHLDAHNIAAAQLFRTRWENRENALRDCIEHLAHHHDMPEQSAELAALQAYAELESANQQARIDVDASTSHMVLLRTEDGRPVVFTVNDLLNVLQQARREQRAVVVGRNRRPVVIEQ